MQVLVDSDVMYTQELQVSLLVVPEIQVVWVQPTECLMQRVEQSQADILIVARSQLDMQILQNLQKFKGVIPSLVFVKHSELALLQAALQAGVCVYIVDDLPTQRLASLLQIAQVRCQLIQQEQRALAELTACQKRLQDRKDIDKAKGLLMQQRGLTEAEAYQLLRKLAMDRNLKIGEVARHLLLAASLLN